MKNLEKVLKRLENEITFYTNETKNKDHDSAVVDRMKSKISVLEDMVVYVERLIKEEEDGERSN